MPMGKRQGDGRLSVLSSESTTWLPDRQTRTQGKPIPRHLDTISGPFSPMHSSVGTIASASPCASQRSCSPLLRNTYTAVSPELSYQQNTPRCPPIQHVVPPAARLSSHALSMGAGKAVSMPATSGRPIRRGSTFSGSSGEEGGSLALPSPPEFELRALRSPSTDAEQVRLQRSHKIKKEIYETECTYVAGLRQLCDYYLEPMKQMLEAERRRGRRGSEMFDSPPAGPKHQGDIFDRFFGSLMLIVSCNTTLLQDMQHAIVEYQSRGAPRGDGDVSDGEITPDPDGDYSGVDYGKLFGNFKILMLYDSYIVHYEEFQAHLREHGGRLSSLVAHAQSMLEQGESTIDVSLNSLLITPIQRLARYRSLLEQLVVLSRTEDESLPALKKACSEILSVINHINEKKREADIDPKVAEIGEDLGLLALARRGRYWRLGGTEMRKISMERGKRVLGPCQVYLLSDILLWVKKKGVVNRKKAHCVQLEEILEVLDYFPGETATSPTPGSPHQIATSAPTSDSVERMGQNSDCAFAVRTTAYTLGLVAASPAQKIVWVDAIREEQRNLTRRSRRIKRRPSNIGIPLSIGPKGDSDG